MKKLIATALLSVGLSAAAATPSLEYLGGVVLCAEKPAELAKWYTEKFGLETTLTTPAYPGAYFGALKSKGVELHFGIFPVGGSECRVAGQGYTLTFRVNDYPGYVALLEKRGLKPELVSTDVEGRFASYRDPAGHMVSIWGD